MKAVILIGGEGTRLRPLTCNIPKAMVPILNRPFLEHLLYYLKQHGIEEVILTLGYFPNPIQGYLGDGSRFGLHVTYVVEKTPLGTAGAVKNVEGLLNNEPFFVLNGDILTEIDLTDMVKRHRKLKPKVSIALTPVADPTMYGVVETDTLDRVKRFIEKPSRDKVTTNLINAGAYMLEPEVLKHIPASTHFMFERNLFPLLLKMGAPIFAYPSTAYWIDIGTPEKYLKAHHDRLMLWSDAEVRTEGECQIHPTAHIKGPALIGENCTIGEGTQIIGPTVLGPRCQIARGVVIAGAVLWGDVQIAEEASLRNCAVGSHSCIERNCQVTEDCVVGDNVTLGRGNRLAPGTRIWPNTRVKPV